MELFKEIKKYFSFQEYLSYMQDLVDQKKTSGIDNREDLVHYTFLNLTRMERWLKTFHLTEEMQQVAKTAIPQIWWFISESWCGDAAENIVPIQKIAEASEGKIDLRVILRDENLIIIDSYLTNGSRSIPKLIALNEKNEQLFVWGPRPIIAQKIILDWKANPNNVSKEDIKKELHLWYAKDKGIHVTNEIMNILKKADN